MLANDDFLFVHYPKTAGKSLTQYFIEAWDRPIHGTVSPGQFDDLLAQAPDGLSLEAGVAHENLASAARILESQGKSVHDLKAVFIGIRNPYDLAVSTYFFLRDRAKYHPDRPRFHRAVSLDFETFWRTEPPTSPPERWLALRGAVLPNQRYIRFESIAEDLARLADEFGFRDASLPHLNPTKHEHYSAYLTQGAEEAIHTRFRYLFELGLYTREPVPRTWRQRLADPTRSVRTLVSLATPKAKATAVEDVTERLEAWIAEATPNQAIALPAGTFEISRTIELPSNITLRGAGTGTDGTKLVLAANTDAPMFTNADKAEGNEHITIEGLTLDGNGRKQGRHEDSGPARAMLLWQRVRSGVLRDVHARDGVQTAFHFTHCSDIAIDQLDCAGMAWSGVRTSGTDRLSVTNTKVRWSGNAPRHAAIQINGGFGVYIDCDVELCSVGVVLSSRLGPLENAVLKAKCKDCRSGIILRGDEENRLHNVLMHECDVAGNDIGIRVTNSANVFIHQGRVTNSWDTGLLLEGRHGGKYAVVTDTRFEGNRKDVQEIHASANNHFSRNQFSSTDAAFRPKDPNPAATPRSLDSHAGVCTVCGETSTFVHNGGSVRESYRCEHCRSSLRYRGQAKAILEACGNGEESVRELSQSPEFAALSIYEPGLVGPFRKYFKDLPNYSQSYYWQDAPLGAVKDGVPNHDLQALDLASDSLDLIVTSDIFEHIRRPWQAFAELHRVLRRGGSHVFTIPLQYPMPAETVRRVDTTTQEDVHLLPEVYHSAGEGGNSLVYTDFGEDMLARLDEIGFSTTISFIDRDRPLCSKNITFVCTKTSA